MVKPSYVLPIDLNHPLKSHNDLQDYGRLRGLVQLWGDPLGWIEVPIQQGICSAQAQSDAILGAYRTEILKRVLSFGLVSGQLSERSDLEMLWDSATQRNAEDCRSPFDVGITVALCLPITEVEEEESIWSSTLESLEAVRAQLKASLSLEILVVGASPGAERIQAWSDARNAIDDRYLPSAADSLSDLRNLAIAQAQQEIVAFFPPQTQVNAASLQAIARSFTADPSIAVVTGPVVPQVFSDTLQVLERHELMVRSFERQWHRYTDDPAERWQLAPFKNNLSEDNFAIRRSALVTSEPLSAGPGSLRRLAFNLCVQGKTVLYEPQAWVSGYGTQTLEALSRKVQTDALVRSHYYTQGWSQKTVPSGYRYVFFRESLGILRWSASSWFGATGLGKKFHAAELKGAWEGFRRALLSGILEANSAQDGKAVAAPANATASSADASNPSPSDKLNQESVELALNLAVETETLREQAFGPQDSADADEDSHTAIRTVDLSLPLPAISDVSHYDRVRLFLIRGKTLLGRVELDNRHGPITPQRLSRELVDALGTGILPEGEQQWKALELQLDERITPPKPDPEPKQALQAASAIPQLPDSVPVSIIITTCDRPQDLRNCLRHLTAQKTSRPVEIIVADNRPASGITPPVIQEFPGVKLVSEPRVGGSYGRNSAFCASTGDIVVTVDDDVTVPPDWLEKLIAPMARPEVMVTTGNVLPRELETKAQRMYEDLYGGLSEGFEPFEADGQWLSSFNYSPPVWSLGVSANSAFRATVFHHPEIGMMPEVLGPGTPVGGGEENYLIYRILKAGYTLVYQPSAYAWHRHRRTVPQLRYQIFRQMMGGTAYHILLWRVDKDPRGLQQLTRSLPRYFTQRLLEKVQGKHQVPWSFLAVEIAGYLNGMIGYWKSLKAVERQGLSAPYIPVSERQSISQNLTTPVGTS